MDGAIRLTAAGADRDLSMASASPVVQRSVALGSRSAVKPVHTSPSPVQARALIEWPDPIIELLGFLAIILPAGAIGFRWFVLRPVAARSSTYGSSTGQTSADAARPFFVDAATRSAAIGLIGVLVGIALAAYRLPPLAARRHLTVGALITTNAGVAMQLGFLALALIGFILAWRRMPAGWVLALIGVVVGALRNALLGQFASLVNPMHELAAGFWIGTLFALVVAGIAMVLRDEPARDVRGPLVADLVAAFSPVALVSSGVLVLFGVITAWRHLKVLSNLWSTPYGYALIVKLLLVAIVFALGAWNWKRQRPSLGSEDSALSIRRSATAELGMAGLVLLATSILVSIPAPRPPGARPPGDGPPSVPAATTTPQPSTAGLSGRNTLRPAAVAPAGHVASPR